MTVTARAGAAYLA